MYVTKISALIIVLIFSNLNLVKAATVYTVTLSSFQTAINAAKAGDTIVLADGTYSNATITVSNPKSNIVIKANTLGGVIFNGNTVVNIKGSHITFLGFQFLKGNNGTSDVLSVYGNYNIITQCNFDSITSHNFIRINGAAQYNEISNCNFEDKPATMNAGPMIQVTIDTLVKSYTKIRYCSFMNCFGLGGDFGNEPIRIGLSTQQFFTSASVVEFCYFENVGLADAETISLKSCFNVVRYNTQNNNPRGNFSFRTGNNNSAYGNFFINSGGIRIKEGTNHAVYNNYFQGAVTNASIDVRNDGVIKPDTVLIYHNTFYRPSFIYLNSGNDTNVPKNVSFVNNILYKTSSANPIFSDAIANANPNVIFTNNQYFGGAPLGVTTPTASQFTNINPQLALNSAGFYTLTATSPGIDNADSLYRSVLANPWVNNDSSILLDIEGKTRPTRRKLKDLGCSEFTTGMPINHPLTRCQTGPIYLCSPTPVKLISFNVSKQNNGNKLVWITENEINNKGFNIQQSSNGISFETIDFVASKGSAATYELIDTKPFATTYYRLQQIDIDGKIIFSNIIKVVSEVNQHFNIYPNPTVKNITISTRANSLNGFEITVKDILGKTIKTISTNQSTSQIDISALTSGMYFVQLVNKQTQTIFTQKIIKN